MYDVAKKVYILHSNNTALFSKILNNKSDCSTSIGKYIVGKPYSTKRADIHGHTESKLKGFAAMNNYQYLTTIHFISQQDVLKHFLKKWSVKSKTNKMLIMDSDRLRAL